MKIKTKNFLLITVCTVLFVLLLTACEPTNQPRDEVKSVEDSNIMIEKERAIEAMIETLDNTYVTWTTIQQVKPLVEGMPFAFIVIDENGEVFKSNYNALLENMDSLVLNEEGRYVTDSLLVLEGGLVKYNTSDIAFRGIKYRSNLLQDREGVTIGVVFVEGSLIEQSN